MEDRELIRRAASRDERAERALFDHHVERLHRVIFRMTGDGELTEELTQEAFVRAFERIGSFRFESSFSTWLTRIAVRVTLSRLDRERRRREVRMPADLPDPGAGTEPEPFLRRRIEDALGELSEGDRAIVAMYVEGYSHEEIAGAMGITAGASKTRLSRARSRLRRKLTNLVDGSEQ